MYIYMCVTDSQICSRSQQRHCFHFHLYDEERGSRKGIHANKLTSTQITDLILVWEGRHSEPPVSAMATSSSLQHLLFVS